MYVRIGHLLLQRQISLPLSLSFNGAPHTQFLNAISSCSCTVNRIHRSKATPTKRRANNRTSIIHRTTHTRTSACCKIFNPFMLFFANISGKSSNGIGWVGVNCVVFLHFLIVVTQIVLCAGVLIGSTRWWWERPRYSALSALNVTQISCKLLIHSRIEWFRRIFFSFTICRNCGQNWQNLNYYHTRSIALSKNGTDRCAPMDNRQRHSATSCICISEFISLESTCCISRWHIQLQMIGENDDNVDLST